MASPASGRVWLVTGCSSGLGRHLAIEILARGDKIIATARRISDLDFISSLDGGKERALCITLDVTEPYNQLREKIDKAIGHFGSIDVLVNNAGFVVSGVWEELRYADTVRPYSVRDALSIRLTRRVMLLIAMRKRTANFKQISLDL